MRMANVEQIYMIIFFEQPTQILQPMFLRTLFLIGLNKQPIPKFTFQFTHI